VGDPHVAKILQTGFHLSMSPSVQVILFVTMMKGLHIHFSFGICHQIFTLMYLDIAHCTFVTWFDMCMNNIWVLHRPSFVQLSSSPIFPCCYYNSRHYSL
jgi:hypothetical protein